MVAQQHLDSAPITEAIIDMQVKLTPDVSIDHLEAISKKLPREYSDIELKNQFLTEVKIEKDAQPSISSIKGGPVGYWCKTSDGLNIAQFRLNGFTFSELKPYTHWESFSKKAKKLWELYLEGVDWYAINRVALRYINHLEVPLVAGEELSKYLVEPPEVPAPLPQSVSSFMYRVTIVEPHKDMSAHVTQMLAPPEHPNQLKILLDIDVFREHDEGILVSEVWDLLSGMRNFKNDIFFEYITEETLETLK